MNYLEIVIQGYFNINNREFLDKYFYREFKKAEKEKFFEPDEFYSGCLKVIEGWDKYLQGKFLERKKELYFMIDGAKNGTMGYGDLQGKTVEEKREETIKYCEDELKYLSPNNFTAHLHSLTRGKVTYNMEYWEIVSIENSIKKALKRTVEESNKNIQVKEHTTKTNKPKDIYILLEQRTAELNELEIWSTGADYDVEELLNQVGDSFSENFIEGVKTQLNKDLFLAETLNERKLRFIEEKLNIQKAILSRCEPVFKKYNDVKSIDAGVSSYTLYRFYKIKTQFIKELIQWFKEQKKTLSQIDDNTLKQSSIKTKQTSSIKADNENLNEEKKDKKKELHNNIFRGNAFLLFESYFKNKEITASSKTDLSVLFQLLDKDGFFKDTVELKHFIRFINKEYFDGVIEEIRRANLNTRPNIQRANDYNLYKNNLKITLK